MEKYIPIPNEDGPIAAAAIIYLNMRTPEFRQAVSFENFLIARYGTNYLTAIKNPVE